MAKEYEIKVPAHKSIYSLNPKEREINVYFCEPENGVNEDTGIVLLIPGYGGNANSNVYKKMRRKFADIYNLVTVQCDYFGQEFMQGPIKTTELKIDINELKEILNEEDIREIATNSTIDFTELANILAKYNHTFTFDNDADLSDENPDNFNDMGIMQAIDNIYAVLYVINILLDNDLNFNAKKIIMYGHSQGAYLAHFCNIMAPTLFSLIIDNSAWVFPAYLNDNRRLTQGIGRNVKVTSYFNYLAKRYTFDKGLYDLNNHYKRFKNQCRILSFQGADDEIIPKQVKRNFCVRINNCSYIEISEDKIDGRIYKSSKHGLDADFLEMFDYVLEDFGLSFKKSGEIELTAPAALETERFIYQIKYEDVLPKIKVYKKIV